MNWLKQQHRALWRFYREELGEALLITAAAFVIIALRSFALGIFNRNIPEFVVNYFQQLLESNDIVTEDGIDLLALFGNNLRACGVSILYGFIPFLYLTALALWAPTP